MNTEYFDKWADIAKKAQLPFQELMELNIKTMQSFSYLTPGEIMKIRKPEELQAKLWNLTFENSHKSLDYMQESIQIMSGVMSSVVKETRTKVKEEINKTGR